MPEVESDPVSEEAEALADAIASFNTRKENLQRNLKQDLAKSLTVSTLFGHAEVTCCVGDQIQDGLNYIYRLYSSNPDLIPLAFLESIDGAVDGFLGAMGDMMTMVENCALVQAGSKILTGAEAFAYEALGGVSDLARGITDSVSEINGMTQDFMSKMVGFIPCAGNFQGLPDLPGLSALSNIGNSIQQQVNIELLNSLAATALEGSIGDRLNSFNDFKDDLSGVVDISKSLTSESMGFGILAASGKDDDSVKALANGLASKSEEDLKNWDNVQDLLMEHTNIQDLDHFEMIKDNFLC